jgi:hypothetical protein
MDGNTRTLNGFALGMEPVEIILSRRKGPRPVWPFDQMVVGETLYVEDPKRFQSAYNSAANIHRRSDKRFTLGRCPAGLRVQRVA